MSSFVTTTVNSSEHSILIDRAFGMIYGVAIGDALGAPHEFYRITPKIKYTGIINTEHTLSVQFQFAKMFLPPATTTDDTAMTLALLESLLDNKMQYNEEHVCVSYWKFANSIKTGLGRNTRSLFKFKCLERNAYSGYKRRYEKGIKGDLQECQSNGSLMRSSPLIFAGNDINDPDQDFSLTNPNPVNEECSQVYRELLKAIYRDQNKSQLKELILILKETLSEHTVKEAITDALKDESKRDISGRSKGWVCHCLYTALRGFFLYNTMEKAMDWIVSISNSDADTNAAVCGSIWGAYLGKNGMSKEPRTNRNVEIINTVSSIGFRLQSLLNRLKDELNKNENKSSPKL